MSIHMKKILFRLSAIIILFRLVAGCSHNQIYRSQFDSVCAYKIKGDCEKQALQIYSGEEDKEYHLAFVEYDDQGQLRDPQQMHSVLDKYRLLAVTDDVLIITFVHGWHHNAGVSDSNIEDFRNKVLKKLASEEQRASKQQNRKQRKILGVYIGWRGESVEIPLANMLTFWDRKNTAQEVGQLGVTEFLLKLEQMVHVTQGIEDPKRTSSRMVVVGHSFGAAVVFGSLQKILMDRFIDSESGKTSMGDAKGFADLVVLINPAFEAIRFSALSDVSQRGCRAYFATQLPKLAILTSESDLATKIAFPIGRSFSTLFESHKTVQRHYCSKAGPSGKVNFELSEGAADRNAVGHFEPLLTHDLNPAEKANRMMEGYQLVEIQNAWANNTGVLLSNGSSLQSRGKTTYLNPYLNIKVSEEISDGHNDIWNDNIVAFIRDLITISTTPQ